MKIVRKKTAVFQYLLLIFFLAAFFVKPATAIQPQHPEKSNAQSSEQVVDLKASKNQGDTSTAHNKADSHHGSGGHANIGEILPLWSCIPFACILLSIALFPLFLPDFWHHHFGKISGFWAAGFAHPGREPLFLTRTATKSYLCFLLRRRPRSQDKSQTENK